MATYFKNVLKSGIGTADSNVLTTGASSKTTVIGLSLSNLTNSILLASIKLTDPNGAGAGQAVTAYFIKDVLVPPNQSLRVVNGGEKLVLGASTTITISSSIDSSLDLVMSYVEII
jgi:hypothetical protein